MIRSRPLWLIGFVAACSTAPRPAALHPASSPQPQQPPSASVAPRSTVESSSADGTELGNDVDKTLYTLGLILGRNLSSFSLTPREIALVQRGMADQLAGERPLVSVEEYGPRVNELKSKRSSAQVEAELERSAVFLEREAAVPNAQRLPSGVIYRQLAPGSGRSPKATDRVKVNYVGTLADGREFDTSLARHEPAEFPLAGVIPCWTEGLQKMRVGERAVLVCPADVAYGKTGRPPTIRGGAALRYEIELVDVVGSK